MNARATFIIEENKGKEYSEVVIKNYYTNEFVSIIPDSGARIKELRLSNGRKIYFNPKKNRPNRLE